MLLRAVACVALLVVSACGAVAASPQPQDAATVTVFAAASLTDAFEAMGEQFEQANPGIDVVVNLAGSATLAAQLVEGAPADVFASADRTHMDVVAAEGLVAGTPADLAANRLEIAVEPGNPRDITGLADLSRHDLTVVLAADEVPAGDYARQALDAQGITVDPASLETDVRAVLSRVALGEADAGIVYASDVASANGAVDGVAIPPANNVVATYPIATLADGPNPQAGADLVAFATSPQGTELLEQFGFSAP